MFGLRQKPAPIVKTKSFDLIYTQKLNQWLLTYKAIEFTYSGHEIALPTPQILDTYISWVEDYQTHIDKKVKEMAIGWGVIDASKAHIAGIEIESPDRIAVMILGDDTWGDLGYDIWMENGLIVKEGFGD